MGAIEVFLGGKKILLLIIVYIIFLLSPSVGTTFMVLESFILDPNFTYYLCTHVQASNSNNQQTALTEIQRLINDL